MTGLSDLAGPGLLRGVDRAALAVSLADRLRRAGVAVDLTAVADLIGTLQAHTPADRDELYWAARITLMRRHADLPAFDAVFAAVFADAVLPMDPHARRRPLPAGRPEDRYAPVPREDADPEQGTGLPWTTLPAITGPADPAPEAPAVPLRLPADVAGSTETPFEELSERQMDLLGGWLLAAGARRSVRRSRRMTVSTSGDRIALRPTLSRARRTGFEVIRLVPVAPRERPRRIVVVCDVSQSMQAQTSAYLHLMRALVLRWDAEAFAFATRLTRLTPALAHRSPEAAVEAATAAVDDRFGGTRIATNLHALLTGRHGGLLRGAIVILGSDGWDADPPEALARVMRRVARRAHRVIWMNPRAGAAGFAPRVATMAAALPFCDAFLPASTFAELARVIDAVVTGPPGDARYARRERTGSGREQRHTRRFSSTA
ncbi:MAG: hypothetical protein BGO26_03955 [Actinobacteria bacterium 69-20]|nr:VWA domain-containing protein [Actinomycetota bacterium]OJV24051.1 MAG: hypothetical protein BGO26_03955 [Actinobacteria bacterium 69-20]